MFPFLRAEQQRQAMRCTGFFRPCPYLLMQVYLEMVAGTHALQILYRVGPAKLDRTQVLSLIHI